MSLRVPGIIFHPAETIPDCLQELSTELPLLAQVVKQGVNKNVGGVECDVSTYIASEICNIIVLGATLIDDKRKH